MPRKARQTNQNLVEQEGRIEYVIQDLKNGRFQKIAPAARAYNIHLNTLRGRLNGRHSQAELCNH